ncbi:MAG: hypothetical protein F7B17_00350 [Desulfurococcales archaeon]|nr:hypothetical protein [Desulfurococcales archaeon]
MTSRPGLKLRLPPRVKVLEAAGAIGGGRVNIIEAGRVYKALVASSGRPLKYRVAVAPEQGYIRVYSDDNGTVHRGYIGYPIISVMMLMGILPRDSEVEKALADVNWYEVNRRLGKYSLVMEEVLGGLPPGVRVRAEMLVNRVMARLRGVKAVYDPALEFQAP